MRVTIDLDEANLRAIEALQAATGKSLSATLNDVLTRGLAIGEGPGQRFVQRSFPMGELMDVSNPGVLLENLDGPAHR